MRHVATTCLLVGGVIAILGYGLPTHAASATDAKTPTGKTSSLNTESSTNQKTAANANDWRYVSFEGRWWYWLPENRWVYWQDNRWNDLPLPSCVQNQQVTYTAGQRITSTSGDSTAGQGQVRPGYGHAQAPILYGPSSEQDQIRPFYGHAIPGRFFDYPATLNEDIRPFYGHAGSLPMH